MIRTKAYITREIKKLELSRNKLKEELNLLNTMATQVGNMPFTSAKRVIRHELSLIEGKLAFADWCSNTSEKALPKIKSKKKKRKKKKEEQPVVQQNRTVQK